MAIFRVQNVDNRAIGFALLVSLALHVALLSILPLLREAQQRRSDASEPIQAHLVEPPPKRVEAPVPQAPPAEAPRHTPAPASPQAAPKRPHAARPAPAGSVEQPAPVVPQASTNNSALVPRIEPAEGGPVISASPAPSAGTMAAAPQTAPPTSEALDTGTLAQYRLSIISAARRFKRYPRVALDQNWQGRVEIRMVIGASGEISALRVRDSAGHEVLDQQALEMIERAKAMVQIPPALRGKVFTVDVPVIFSLREAGG